MNKTIKELEAKVKSIYPDAICSKSIHGDYYLVTTHNLKNSDVLSSGDSKKEAWMDAYRYVIPEITDVESKKETFIDAVYSSALDVCQELTLDEILELLDEARIIIKKSLPKEKYSKNYKTENHVR